jgi:hypothetical protein
MFKNFSISFCTNRKSAAVEELKKNFAGSPYAARAALISASVAFSSKDLAKTSAYRVEGNKRLISIGAIKPLFHIKMYLNNETAIRGSDSKVINLKDVKIISESVSSASTNDAPVLISYSFIFKDVERG